MTNLTYIFNVKQEEDDRNFVENSLQIFTPFIKEKIATFVLSSQKGKQIIYDPKLEYNKNETKVVASREGAFGYIFAHNSYIFLKRGIVGENTNFFIQMSFECRTQANVSVNFSAIILPSTKIFFQVKKECLYAERKKKKKCEY